MARTIQYEDLSLAIEPAEGEAYRVRALSSPYGHAVEPFALPLERQELEEMVRAVGSLGSYFLPGEVGGMLQEIGARLFHALFHGTLREMYLRSRGRLEAAPDHGLRIRIVLPVESAAAGLLQALPWELLYWDQDEDFLARNVLTPVVRQIGISGASSAIPTPDLPTIRILIAVASPRGLVPLENADEHARILEAWCQQEKAEVRLLEAATLQGLYEALRSDQYQVVHLISHGTFDSDSGVGSVVLETKDGEPQNVAGRVLAETLRASRELRLVFLNSCESAHAGHLSGQSPLLSVAASLARRGIPAVLAMQFPISDLAARIFSEGVYRSLARGSSLEAAVVDGRLALYHETESAWEWATPTLTTALSEPSVFWPLCRAEEYREERDAQAVTQAIQLLLAGAHEQAAKVLEECSGKGVAPADHSYYLALARLGGRRPRDLSLTQLRPIEAVARSVPGATGCAAHHLCFVASLQRDFYLENYLTEPEPASQELLRRAGSAPPMPEKLAELLRIAPWAKPTVDLFAQGARTTQP